MPADDHYLSERNAFWVLLGVQQVVTAIAVCRLLSVLRTCLRCAVLPVFYACVLVYSLIRTLFFLDVALNYPLFAYELLDTGAICAYLCVMSLFCWLWWDVFLQFSTPFCAKRRRLNTLFFLIANVVAALWNFLSVLLLFLLPFHKVENHYVIHLSAAVECLFVGVSVQRAGQHAKCVVRGLLKGSTTRISLVQFSGVACSLLQSLVYTLAVGLYKEYEEMQRTKPAWQRSLVVLLFYSAIDLIPLSMLLWLVRVGQERERTSVQSSFTNLSEARLTLRTSHD